MNNVQVGHQYLIPLLGTHQWVRVLGPAEDLGFWLCELSDTGELLDVPGPVLEMNSQPLKASA